jgi:hypothetical protein
VAPKKLDKLLLPEGTPMQEVSREVHTAIRKQRHRKRRGTSARASGLV